MVYRARITLLALFVAVFAGAANAGFLYVVNDAAAGNTIYGFSVDEATGTVTPLAGFPVASGAGGGLTNLEMIAIDRVNKRLYVVDRGSATVSGFAIDPATGSLTPLPFSPIATGIAAPRTLDVHPSGSPIIVGGDTIASLNVVDGVVSHAKGSPYALQPGVNPAGATLTPNGGHYFTGGNTGNFFSGYTVNAATGVLTPLAGSPFDSGNQTPNPTAADATGRIFVINSRQALSRVYSLADGVLTQAVASPFANGMSGFASQGKVHPNGKFFVLADRTGACVSSYEINGAGTDTTLSTVLGSPFAAGGTGTSTLVFSRSGDMVFAANGSNRNVSIFRVDAATGVLSDRQVLTANIAGSAGTLNGIDYVDFTPAAIVTVSGRVVDHKGGGVSRATVRMNGTNGVRTAITNGFGYFSFDNVESLQTYNLSATHKLYSFGASSVWVASTPSDVTISAD